MFIIKERIRTLFPEEEKIIFLPHYNYMLKHFKHELNEDNLNYIYKEIERINNNERTDLKYFNTLSGINVTKNTDPKIEISIKKINYEFTINEENGLFRANSEKQPIFEVIATYTTDEIRTFQHFKDLATSFYQITMPHLEWMKFLLTNSIIETTFLPQLM
jgi:hypothetical protein